MIQSITSTNGTANRNPGIVPPWLTKPAQPKNPGIVPPWLLEPITILPVEDVAASEPITILPVAEPEFHILPFDGETQFVPMSAVASPATLADALRGR